MNNNNKNDSSVNMKIPIIVAQAKILIVIIVVLIPGSMNDGKVSLQSVWRPVGSPDVPLLISYGAFEEASEKKP